MLFGVCVGFVDVDDEVYVGFCCGRLLVGWCW